MNALPFADTGHPAPARPSDATAAAATPTPAPATPAPPAIATRLQHLLRRHPPGQAPHPLAAVLAAYHQRQAEAVPLASPTGEPAP